MRKQEKKTIKLNSLKKGHVESEMYLEVRIINSNKWKYVRTKIWTPKHIEEKNTATYDTKKGKTQRRNKNSSRK